METMNIFEIAAKDKFRYNYHGMLTTEDLYSLKVEQLDDIFKALNAQKKAEMAATQKAQNERIKEIIARKKDAELEGKSIDELTAMLSD